MKIVCLGTQKGGTGKTTVCHALGVGLANRGFRVLFCDLDAQTNLSDLCGFDTETTTDTLYSVFRGEIPIEQAIQPISSGIDLALGDLLFSKADSEFLSIGRERLLQKALKPLENAYDFVVCDTAPALSILLANALTASDFVIIPCTPGRFSLKGMRQLGKFIDEIREDRNPKLAISGILINKYAARYTTNRIFAEEIATAAEELGTTAFNTRIRQSVAVDTAQALQGDIYSGKSAVATDFNSFVDEFLERIK